MRGLAFAHGTNLASIAIRSREIGRSPGTAGTNEAFEQAKLVRRILRARAVRDDFLSPRLFSEPAWDMLLELYVAHLLQRRLSVTDVCEASRVSYTTALRWINVLAAEEFVCRKKDPLDGRRMFIDLTSSGSEALQHYFEAISDRVWPAERAGMGVPFDAPTPAVAM